jgi:ATP-binding cassette subfamily B protein
LLLGWHRPASGRVLVDGVPLAGEGFDRLRRKTAWVDPAVQIWNRTFLDNLQYGITDRSAPSGEIIAEAELYGVLARLRDGQQTMLGEGGGLVSGGEGQRVRLARAMFRDRAGLVLLDEPFRGLDRERRHKLLLKSKQRWRQATLLCVTHDVGETLVFERVLVIEGGRIVEDGVPTQLAQDPGSRYRALLDAEDLVRNGLWADDRWRRVTLERGRLHTPPDSPPPALAPPAPRVHEDPRAIAPSEHN